MYSVFYVLLFILAVRTDGFPTDDVQCDHVFRQQCHEDANNYNVVGYNSSVVNYCTAEDVPSEINFTVILGEIERGELTHFLKIDFKPPKTECRYGVALLVNSAIRDEGECLQYTFEDTEDIATKVHTIEKTLCVLTNSTSLIKYNDNSTVSLCKDNIKLWFQYIFTGCYALRFHVGRDKYIIKGHKFLSTTYRRMEITQPQFTCKYNIHSNPNQSHEMVNFTLDTSLSADIRSLLIVKLISDRNEDPQKPCIWYGEQPIHRWTVDLANEALEDSCSKDLVQTMSGEYMKTVLCNFEVQTIQTTDYCFIFHIIDDRCHKNTSWKPPVNGKMPCTWLKRCVRTFETSQHVESIKESDEPLDTSSYLLLPIIAIVLIVSTIVGTLCFMHYLRIRNEEVNLYVNPQQDDFTNPACFKSTDFGIIDNNDSEKGINHDNLMCDDIILLYTKSSSSFMALMKDFREILAKMCSCSVHDWHDGAEWNNVAKIGAVLWFTELLNSGCRVVWIDTPTTRSTDISNSRENKKNHANLNKLNKYHEIGDFRDVAFPVVLELTKRNVKDLTLQYRKHFVVRFEGLESSENKNDPFSDLSPHTRYLIPRHLAQLCSDLSTVKPIISEYEMKVEEDLLQQRLKFIKIGSIM